jgi:hypothetical protein
VLRETTSRGLCGLGCPSRTSERGGEGDCVKEGGGGEGQDLVQSCLHWGGGDMGGHVLRETTSRGLCGLVCHIKLFVYQYGTRLTKKLKRDLLLVQG